MFMDALEEMAGVPDVAVDASIRELELQLRVAQAELAAVRRSTSTISKPTRSMT